MKIKSIISQHRRDLWVVFECEHCGQTEEGSGYDDAFFHNSVVPEIVCKVCNRSAGEDYVARLPKYAEGVSV